MATLRQLIEANVWNPETQQFEPGIIETAAQAVKTTDGSDVQTKLDAVPGAISTAVSDAVTALKGGVDTAGDNLAKLYGLIGGLQALVESDDVDLDTVQEIVTYIKANKDALTLLGGSKVNISDVVNELDVVIEGKVLDARQGKALKDLIDGLQTSITALQSQAEGFATSAELTSGLNAVRGEMDSAIAAAVPVISDTPPANPIDKQIWWKPVGTIEI